MEHTVTAGEFGNRLREARERRGITLRQIAVETRISMRALEALERNDISQLPGGIFSRAFVRTYAVQVGLDPEATVEEFLRHFPHEELQAGHPPSYRFGIEDSEMQPASMLVPWLLLVTGVALVVALLMYLFFRR
ncbi:MAG: helix-turn-helix domain-containing protein [Acidobacteriaceae bacterium]|jgi:cytoskeletal protein RodZ|nr:helix-turn-helix domain-containing protein [Acidobacteriaceae bacterium]